MPGRGEALPDDRPVAFVLIRLLKEVPLAGRRHTAPDTARELAAASAPGTADPDAGAA